LRRVRGGGRLEVDAYDRDMKNKLASGTLLTIDNQIDQTTGTAKFKATFANTRNRLWPGQYVNARVLVRTERQALTLPTAAVQLGPNGPFTYVVKADSTVEVRPLKIGADSGGMTIVTAGLAENEHVVTSNQYRLQAGAHVREAATAVARRRISASDAS
jgi:multidrug efflux system membrane fusion protein